MKALLLALAAAVVGTAGGLTTALWRFGLPNSGDPFGVTRISEGPAIEGAPRPAPDGARPRLLARIKGEHSVDVADAVDPRTGELTYDFGVMAQHTSNRTEFIFKNVGDAVLELKKGQSTCQCTLSELPGTPSAPDQAQVRPGEETVVVLNWKTDGPEGPFRHRADILTNDPSRKTVRLVVNGTLARGVRVEPLGLSLGRIGFREGTRAEFTVVAFQSDDMQIRQCSLAPLGDAADADSDPTAKLAEFSYVKLTPAELKVMEAAPKCGYRVTLSLKPGLPLGRIDRKIHITTNLIEPVEMPVTGIVAGDVSVAEVGDWFAQFQFFNLGETQSDKGVSKSLYLMVGGQNAQNVQVKLKQTIPAELQAKIGTPRPSGQSMRWPITIAIPPGTRPMSHADAGEYGKVILETTHPQQKEFVIDVSFLVNKARN